MTEVLKVSKIMLFNNFYILAMTYYNQCLFEKEKRERNQKGFKKILLHTCFLLFFCLYFNLSQKSL